MSSFQQQCRLSRKEQGQTEAIALVESRKKSQCRISKCSGSDSELPDPNKLFSRFGPLYNSTGDTSLVSTAKDAAWKHVSERLHDKQSETELQVEDLKKRLREKQLKTKEIYLSAMRRIEEKARQTYADGTVLDNLKGSDFLWMMIKDGCFLLQLALFALGGDSVQLGYPPDNLIFGNTRNKKSIKMWIESMFFVGNQIPLVVLNELMKQSFFKGIISRVKWERSSELSKRALYELLLLPALESTSPYRTFSTPFQGLYQKWGLATKVCPLNQQSSDLLHGLQLLLLGPGTDQIEDEIEEGDLEGGAKDSSNDKKFSSATVLRKAGIKFKNAKGMGIRGIKFTSNWFSASLTLPTFTVDDETEMLFNYLKTYETIQQPRNNKREVSCYLRFMSELVRTPEDAKLLANHGIIQANPQQREKLPGMLSKLASNQHTNQHFQLVRLQISDYSGIPWGKIQIFGIAIFILTVVQTVFTMLSYFHDHKR